MATLAVTFHVDTDDLPADFNHLSPEVAASTVYDMLDEGDLDITDIYDNDVVDFLEVSVVEEDDD